MTAPPPERPCSLEEIVSRAESLADAERLTFLKNACSHDDSLLAQALERLRKSSPDWWDQSIETKVFDPFLAALDRVGEHIGPYRIIRTLGQGGMGDVVLAERDDQQFRQQVAIKLVKRGALSRNVQGRLKAERQILASLDHPNIARLLDGGTMQDGMPYIVMEFIDGEPIDEYCDRLHLPIEERLKIFRLVCNAVHAAHQNLIVHRDLKPSNILVQKDGTPKLLDFGIAKILDERHLIHTMAVTQMDMRVMTPEHASPEQIRGDVITTASDVYALGVLLYELLTGRKPYDFKTSRFSEMEKVICEQPPRPLNSALFRDDDSTAQKVADDRSTSLARLRRQLAGELEDIVRTALRKEPERRYSSAEQFSSDIGRYMAGLPVAASKGSWQYRAGKFIKRHRIAVASGGLAFAGLAIFAITTTLQAQRIAREQARTAQISSFLIDMFQQADPSHSRGRDLTVREMLTIGSRRIETELADQPDTRTQMQVTIGKVYADLGLYEEAERLLQKAVDAREQLYGERHIETAKAMHALGDVLVQKKELSGAAPLLESALDIGRSTYGNNSVEIASMLNSVSELRQEQGNLDQAEKLLNESLRILSRAAPSAMISNARIAEETAWTLNRLATVMLQKRDFATAEVTWRRALVNAESSLGLDHPTVAFLKHNLAHALESQGNLRGAQPLYQDALTLYKKVLGAGHPETIIALANYGSLLHRLNDLTGAETTLREVVALRQKALGERHERVGFDRVNLGMVLYYEGRFDQAETELRSALDIFKNTLPSSHPLAGSAHRSLGLILIAEHRLREAESEINLALNAFKSAGANDPQLLTTRAAQGKLLLEEKRYADAEIALRDTYDRLRTALGDEHPSVVRTKEWLDDASSRSVRVARNAPPK